MKTAFISREPELTHDLGILLEAQGIRLLSVSQITTRPLDYPNPVPASDWVFFYSPKGVRYFFEAHPVFPAQPRFGAISEGTAKALSAYAHADFTGMGTDTETSARNFANLVGEGTVMTPQSDISLDVLSRILKGPQVIPLICYQTREHPVNVGFPDVLVFSSPANVRAFCLVNQVLPWQKIIAFGPSTATALRAQSMSPDVVLAKTSDEEMARAIIQVIHG